MPNWCMNKLIVAGPKEHLATFQKKVRKGKDPFNFQKIIPMPKKLLEEESPNKNSGVPDWYVWCLKNWGTKWNVCDVNMTKHDNEIHLNFDTAWSPPIPIIIKLMTMFPKLSFRLTYCEPGVGFSGIFGSSDGMMVDEEYSSKDQEHLMFMKEFGLDDEDVGVPQ